MTRRRDEKEGREWGMGVSDEKEGREGRTGMGDGSE